MSVDLSDGSKVNGQVIGVYNERPFMWHPKDRDTLALFRCDHPGLDLDSFGTNPSSECFSNDPFFCYRIVSMSYLQVGMQCGVSIPMK